MRDDSREPFAQRAGAMSEDEILHDFPDLEREKIRAARAFAAEREKKIHRSSAA